MKCQNCGTVNARDAKFCEKCGNALATEKNIVCPHCGHKNKSTAKHCVECGTSLVQPEQEAEKSSQTPERIATSKKKISPLIWVLGGFLGAILLCLAIFLFGLIKLPEPPQPGTSALPQFIVSAWTSAYTFQTTGSFSLASADISGKYVEALFNCDEKKQSPIYASTGVRIHDYITWWAGTQGQVQDFQKYTKFDVSIDGAKAAFQGPFQYEIKQNAQQNAFGTPVLVVLGSLPAGTHHIRTEITWSQKIYDGEDYFGPGSANEKLTGNCTLVINQPASGVNKAEQQQAQVPNAIPAAQAGGCERNVTKAVCEADGGTWSGLNNEVFGEKYCICKNDPKDPAQRDKNWCNSQGGTWVDLFNQCSFMNQCAKYTDQNACTANNGNWYDPGKYCWCVPFDKNTWDTCRLDPSLKVDSMIYDSTTDHFKIDISQSGTPFPPGSDFDIKVTKNSQQVGVLGCKATTQNKLSCEQDALPEFKQNWPGATLNICRDVYCCVNVGPALIQTQSGNLFGLAGNCPPASSITSENMQWQKGKILLDVVNPDGWPGSANPYQAILNIGVTKWTDLKCFISSTDGKVLKCTGWGTYKTGGVSLSMDFEKNGEKCSLSGVPVKLWNRCSTPGYGYCPYIDKCCPSDSLCCPKGCYPKSSYSKCPS